jgi:hypothetical protein
MYVFPSPKQKINGLIYMVTYNKLLKKITEFWKKEIVFYYRYSKKKFSVK